MFCIRHSYTQLQRWLHCAVLQALLHVSLCTPCLVYGVHAVQVQSVTRFLSEHMFPMRSALKILNLHITAATCGRPVMPSASGCSNMLPCTQCLQSGAQQTPSPRMLHTLAHTVACCLIVLASCQCGCSFLTAAHMKPRDPKATLPTCPCCTLYEQHTPCCTQTHTHKHMLYANVLLFLRATQMSQRYALYPSF
jgi:hypothetical protein